MKGVQYKFPKGYKSMPGKEVYRRVVVERREAFRVRSQCFVVPHEVVWTCAKITYTHEHVFFVHIPSESTTRIS